MKLAPGRLVARGGFGEKIRQSLGAPAPACLSPPRAQALGPAVVGLSAVGAALALLQVILRDGKMPRLLTLDTSPRGHPGLPGCRPWLFVLRCKHALKLAHAPGVPLCRWLSLEHQ